MTKLKYTLDRRTLDHVDGVPGTNVYEAIQEGLKYWTYFFGFELEEAPGGVHIKADNLPYGYGGYYKDKVITINYSPSTAGNIVRWNTGGLVLIVAHEVGHYIGYPHIGNSCADRMKCNVMFTYGGFWGSDANGRNGAPGPIDVAYGRQVLKFGPSNNPIHPYVNIYERDIRPLIKEAQNKVKRINEVRKLLASRDPKNDRKSLKNELDKLKSDVQLLKKTIDPATMRLEEIVKPYGSYHRAIYDFQFNELFGVKPKSPKEEKTQLEYRCMFPIEKLGE